MENQAGWSPEMDWYWEGNVQKRIVEYMESLEGYEILQAANTGTKERGPDILAEKDGVRRLVSVKGYPSDKYMSGSRMGQKKPTKPALQAKHWFAEAIFDLVRAKSSKPETEIALGFPKVARYLRLLNDIRWFREKLGVFCYLVAEDGKVELLASDESP